MKDQDDLLAEIGALLEVETTPAFTTAVLARVNESRRRTRQVQWALAAAASIALAAGLLWRPSIDPASMDPLVPVPATTVSVAKAAPEPVAPVALELETPTRATARTAAPSAATVEPVASSSAEPHLEVITNQGEVLRALWVHAARASSAVLLSDANEATGTELAKPVVADFVVLVDPVVVPAVVVSEIGGSSGRPGGTEAERINRRLSATQESK